MELYKKIELEIGFGYSCILFNLAKSNPDVKFVGVEIEKSCFEYKKELKKYKNVELIHGDINLVIKSFQEKSISRIHIYFPSPRPSHKRYITKKFVMELSRIIKKGGTIKIVTDVLEYFLTIEKLFENQNWRFISWQNLPFVTNPSLLVGTGCEKIYHSKYYLECKKN